MNSQYDAQGLARLGRYGDSTLVHMQPREVAGLQALAQSQGTSLTTNPDTGLPEAFNIGNFLAALAPTAAGFLVGGPAGAFAGSKLSATAAPIIAGAATGAIIAEAKGEDPLMGGFMGGIGGYGGGNLATSAANFGTNAATNVTPAAEVSNFVPNQPYMPPAPQAPYSAPQIPVGGKITGPGTDSFGPNFATTPGGGFDPNPVNLTQSDPMLSAESLAQNNAGSSNFFGSNVQNIASDPFRFVQENPFGVGSPLVMGAVAGMTPDGMPMNENEDKYDPYATLNLG
jgi:hypothetical protein